VTRVERQRSDQPENAERLTALVEPRKGSLRQALFEEALFVEQSQEVTQSEIYRVHEHEYLKKLIDLC